MSNKLQRKQININLSEGRTGSTATDDFGSINVSRLENTDKMEDAFHKIELIIDKLAPETPPRLDDSVLSLVPINFSNNPIGYVASARIADGVNGLTVSNILRQDSSYTFTITGKPSSEPTINNGYAYDADIGDLEASLDSSSTVTIPFTINDDTQTVTSNDSILELSINSERDYFNGIAGKEGFWKAFRSSINLDPGASGGSLDPSNIQHQLEISHSNTGTQNINFYIEDPAFPSLSSLSGLVNMTEQVSGLPTTSITDNIFGNFTVTNAVKNFYRNDLMTLSGPNLTTENYNAGVRSSNDIITDQLQVNSLANVFRDSNIELTFTARDAFNNSTANTISLSDKRIDTSSITIKNRDLDSNSGRYLGNSNQPITSGGNGIPLTQYDHSISLLQTNYNLQLQVINGAYTYPISNDYSLYNYFNGTGNVPGPDYSVGIIESKRWASFNYNLITNKALTQQVIINILNNNGITTTNQLQNRINLYYKVITWAGPHGGAVLNETVWIESIGNVNAATFNNGDPYMVGNSSNTETSVRTDNVNGAHIGSINQNSRILTTGNNITGNGTNVSVHVRIGISIGETFSFNGLSVNLN